ncbi:sialate O-acetylesterase [Tichowtungia aerotolerans]|uniref:Sialate O-acetylesterase domain-containing protein n=1 Tax=Tichowtungia aerotolerans TaxID=2697043 RepID=A0A6P1MFU5_9BACT|nr:sialate O-acetylesterase [Tichowtungia aerotolerans]QHI69945.1 hypothetical protein GT409_10940 [Tichowtungia aerotolerans]
MLNKTICILSVLAQFACAELGFAPVFNDGAVLQCEMPVNIWGTADPGATVTVSFAGQTKTAVADSSKHWKIVLDPMSASSEPRELSVLSSVGNQKSSIDNVVVGEVWLASGQSNMAFGLGGDKQGAKWTAKTLPELHYILVPRKTGIPVERDYTSKELAWKSFKPGQSGPMSAVAFYFAKEIKDATGRQVGIIQSAAAGTPIQAWTPISALDAHPRLKPFADNIRAGIARGRSKEVCLAEVEADHQWYLANREWQKTKEGPQPVRSKVKAGNPWFHRSPTVLYKNMIEPLTQYTVRGILWYQGENNIGNPPEYQVMFPAMIEAWRSAWNRPDLPFLFVQLPGWSSPAPWAEFRAAQAVARETLGNVGMAVAIDCGEKNDIHPKNKQPVGERLARLALADVYGQDVVSRGPLFQTLKKVSGRIQVVFQCSGNGLKTSDGKADLPGFEVAGVDGVYHAALAHIVGKDTVDLVCSDVRKPVSVRYAWASWIEPPVTLQNSAGLPAEPFQGDL